MAPPARRLVILRTSRDTLVLVACAVGMTLAMAYSVHQRPAAATDETVPPAQVWAGQLADLGADPAVPAKPEALTSASLVVPEAAMALPAAPPAAPIKGNKAAGCDGSPCPGKAAPTPPVRQKTAALGPEVEKVAPPHAGKSAARSREKYDRFGLADLNPIPHLPDAVRKPFSYAGAKISSLIDWF